MSELPIAPVDRLIRKAGAERVSKDAAKVLAEYIEKRGMTIAVLAAVSAKIEGRKTVKAKDIAFAIDLIDEFPWLTERELKPTFVRWLGPQWPREVDWLEDETWQSEDEENPKRVDGDG